MDRRRTFTKTLAIAGTIIVWIPVLFMVVTSIAGSIAAGKFLCDYLIPAELFLVELAGAALIFAAAYRAKVCLRAVGWNCGAIVLFLFAGMMIAQVSGLAHGDREPQGLIWIITIGSMILYTLSVTVLGIAGIVLVRALGGGGRNGTEQVKKDVG